MAPEETMAPAGLAAPGEPRPAAAGSLSPLLRRAVIYGACPLIAAGICLLGFLATRAPWFPVAGVVLVIPFGFGFAIAALILLARFRSAMRERDRRSPAPEPWRARFWLALGFVLTNFPAAWLSLLAGEAIQNRVSITVVNESGRELRSVVLDGPGIRRELGRLAPGRSRNVWVFPKSDGQLDLRMSDRTGERVETVAGVPSALSGLMGCGAEYHVEVRPDLLIQVREIFPR
jgi:hypothetical protein